MNKFKNSLLFFAGFLFAVIAITGIRFATYRDESTHFHANFSAYINGKQVDFNQDKYMEEVSACSLDTEVQPKQRVHMHNKVGNLVHVHDHGVTWGHFLINIGWNGGRDYLIDDSGAMYQADEQNKVRFVLNGNDVSNISNVLIKSEDTLLIVYGNDSDETVSEWYEGIEHSAHDANSQHDPASCRGTESLTFVQRLKKAFLK